MNTSFAEERALSIQDTKIIVSTIWTLRCLSLSMYIMINNYVRICKLYSDAFDTDSIEMKLNVWMEMLARQ